jgi:hypothetical protein
MSFIDSYLCLYIASITTRASSIPSQGVFTSQDPSVLQVVTPLVAFISRDGEIPVGQAFKMSAVPGRYLFRHRNFGNNFFHTFVTLHFLPKKETNV